MTATRCQILASALDDVKCHISARQQRKNLKLRLYAYNVITGNLLLL